MRRRWILLAVLLSAGCGGSSDEGGGPIQVALTEFSITPATITVEEAGTYEFEVANEGQFPHALDIEADDAEAETGNIGPGESKTISLTLAAGSHEMYCPIGNHRDQGMEGTVAVGGSASGENETESTTTDDDPGY
jgi:uncharacterized cupredoxin-like copper-binding protein